MSQVYWRNFGRHENLTPTDHDESARLDYIIAFFNHLSQKVWTGHRDIYEKKALPKFLKQKKRKPKNRHEVREIMLKEPYFQAWSMMRVFAQANTYAERRIMVEKHLDDLIEISKPRKNDIGKLELDSELPIPRYQSELDMHWQPGGYVTEFVENDVSGGAMYDLGGLYNSTNGMLGIYNAGAAYAVIDWIVKNYKGFKPKRILDLGCTVGHNTLPFKEYWKKSEVIGIDIGAPVLRYAHRRANSLGVDITFSQQNAECTRYEDESFDLIVSTMFLHETSTRAVYNIVQENHRLLKPGGMMIHVEQPTFDLIPDPFDQLMKDWDTHNNNEPFWGTMHDMDLSDVVIKGGFSKDSIIKTFAPLITPTEENKFNIGKGQWFIFGATKT